MAWMFESGSPIYRQLADRIRLEIASGHYAAGEQIPPVREMALEAGVNPNTMQKALSQLEQEGLVHAQRTAGRFISQDEKVLGALREELAEGFVQTMLEKLQGLGLDDKKILQVVQKQMKKEDQR